MRDSDGGLFGSADAGGTYQLDTACCFEAVDGRAAQLLGQPAWVLVGRSIWEAFPALRAPLQPRYEVALGGGGASRFVFRQHRTDRWYAVSVEPIGPQQAPSGLLVRFADVTTDLAGVRETIAAERLEAAAEVAGRLAHDINNGLTVVLGNAEWLEEELADRPELLEIVRMIAGAAERSAALTRRVLRFAAHRRATGGQTQPAPFLQHFAARLTAEAPNWPVLATCEPGLPPVLADAADLEAALSELVLNARAALPEGGGVRLIARAAEKAERVVIAVADGGCGMPPRLRQRCMEPFVTSGQRQGLGLSLVHGFALAHGATVQISSDVGAGTTVALDLPAGPPAAEDPAPPRADAAMPGHVLLVEDDPDGRAYVARLLGSLGYRVTATAGSRDALETLRNGPRPALLVADVVLPGGADGPLLVEEARRFFPELPAVLISGYAAQTPGDGLEPASGVPLLAKPFRKADLEGVLRKAVRSLQI